MSQPIWQILFSTDSTRVLIDATGVYPPEMEIATEIERGEYYVHRFTLDRLTPEQIENEWFAKSLHRVATCSDTTYPALEAALCSENPSDRAWAYESIGSYHGLDNLDSYPLVLTEDELNDRWGREPMYNARGL